MSLRWVKLDVGYLSHPKIIGLDPKVKLLHVASILWTAEHLTDGYVPDEALISLSSRADLASNRRRWAADLLVERGLWEIAHERGGGWLVHDFVEHNRASTRAAVELSREQTRKRVQQLRERASHLRAIE